MQTKRAEPSAVVDYEKIDEDARVSSPFSISEMESGRSIVAAAAGGRP